MCSEQSGAVFPGTGEVLGGGAASGHQHPHAPTCSGAFLHCGRSVFRGRGAPAGRGPASGALQRRPEGWARLRRGRGVETRILGGGHSRAAVAFCPQHLGVSSSCKPVPVPRSASGGHQPSPHGPLTPRPCSVAFCSRHLGALVSGSSPGGHKSESDSVPSSLPVQPGGRGEDRGTPRCPPGAVLWEGRRISPQGITSCVF